MPQQQPLTHLLAAQVEVTVAQPHFLAHVSHRAETAAARSGSASRARLAQQLDLAGFQVARSRCPRGRARTRPVTSSTNSLRTRSALANTSARIRIEHDLQQALPVAQVDEDDAAMIAAAVRPAGHRDDFADRRFVDLTAILSAHSLEKARESARCYG